MARPRVASGALFFDAEGRLLLVKPTYKDGWDIPGGYVEPGETPREACEREVAEELGIRPRIGDLLVADWAPSEARATRSCSCLTAANSTPARQIRSPCQPMNSAPGHSMTKTV
jgi:ADP-ribose pyrophosphatase YjhB (NUDIX family)